MKDKAQKSIILIAKSKMFDPNPKKYMYMANFESSLVIFKAQ